MSLVQIRVALRQKSEIEQYRNKIRLRAKRKGHYDFPTMDDLMDGFEPKDVYQKAQLQFDRILDPDVHVPSVYMEPRKRSRVTGQPLNPSFSFRVIFKTTVWGLNENRVGQGSLPSHV